MMETRPPAVPSLDQVRAFLSDMDGTLYVEETLLPGAAEFVAKVRRKGFPLLFLTNNSSARGETYRDRLRGMGIDAESEDILTSGHATAHYLRAETDHQRVLLLGTPSLRAEFEEAGFDVIDAEDRREPDCVVLGFDKTLTYARLSRACLLLAEGCPYFATHPDYTCITPEGLIPDTGALIEAIDSVVHRRPKVIGKPMPEMVAAALHRIGAVASETAMVGDQLDTDITMANRAGLFGVLLLSGETSRERLEAESAVHPSLVLDSVADLARLF